MLSYKTGSELWTWMTVFSGFGMETVFTHWDEQRTVGRLPQSLLGRDSNTKSNLQSNLKPKPPKSLGSMINLQMLTKEPRDNAQSAAGGEKGERERERGRQTTGQYFSVYHFMLIVIVNLIL